MPDVVTYEIHGDIKENANDVAMRFQAAGDQKRVLIYTIKSGASWTAHAASTGFFIGYEWSMNDNDQAIDRIHRIGQHDKVLIKFLLHRGTVDEAIMDKLDIKKDAASWILRPEEMLAKLKELHEQYKK
jgi:SWI/SNF-related matrix-associated actin-dependent regulator 1 of chromatin subfamily A